MYVSLHTSSWRLFVDQARAEHENTEKSNKNQTHCRIARSSREHKDKRSTRRERRSCRCVSCLECCTKLLQKDTLRWTPMCGWHCTKREGSSRSATCTRLNDLVSQSISMPACPQHMDCLAKITATHYRAGMVCYELRMSNH
mmetsp:Transcript_14265/g.39318  ORF Transcript_14265/g.39318 Transcript_14265/m.39318 type:complete len:142 (+) Transcript_14265:781-1206(+)